MGAEDGKLVLGRINGAFGVKGWVKIQSFTAQDAGLFAYPQLWCRRQGDWEPIELHEWRRHGKGFVASIKGCEDRNSADTFARCDLGVDEGELPSLAPGEYYWHQLLELEVAAISPPVLLGKVDSLLETGSNDVLVVHPVPGSLDNRERLIPFRIGDVVREVDLAGGRITVDWDPDY